MSRLSTSRLLAQNLFQSLSRPAPSTPLWTRAFSQTPQPRVALPPKTKDNAFTVMETLARSMKGEGSPVALVNINMADELQIEPEQGDEPYHFHIYAHRHNTHVTVTKPNRDAIISLSCGNLGFKKSNRKHYDSAYQLGAYVVDKLHQKGIVKDIHKLEVTLRGFGAGREAVVKVLLGNEGKMLRSKIVRVSDATRLKFGGTRSPKPRRLG
ncbi:hypothetical protein B0T25DRAFT_332056 [Lasiosphaeria hispida]|uniref:Small ribosomal subunit protein uS11m n=1 Tax=Lasiosphaeria hispida TaxID=260671 RepID=A0AAJ0M806_9PEZI|nr:hypothetical protein B0T25DRAFT_332056 [Lasiosphaeria hispida]